MFSQPEVRNLKALKAIPCFSITDRVKRPMCRQRSPRPPRYAPRSAAGDGQLPSQRLKTLSKKFLRSSVTARGFTARGSPSLPSQPRDPVLPQVFHARTSAERTGLYKGTTEESKHQGLCWRKAQIKPLGCCEVQRETGRQRSDEIIH